MVWAEGESMNEFKQSPLLTQKEACSLLKDMIEKAVEYAESIDSLHTIMHDEVDPELINYATMRVLEAHHEIGMLWAVPAKTEEGSLIILAQTTPVTLN